MITLGVQDPCGDTHTALGTTILSKQALPSSVPKHEEEDTEYDACDTDVDPNDDAGRGGLIVLLVLHAVARGIQHCQEKKRRGAQWCSLPLGPPAFGGPRAKAGPWAISRGRG